ncbi:hypothetical protein ES703_07500 [subsurface metagenome]
MKRIISVSRRTDIPAFYGDWFMHRLKEGFAGLVHPFGGNKYIIPLRPEKVICFVFWSKNFSPFIENLKIIDELGYKFYFNYTVTASYLAVFNYKAEITTFHVSGKFGCKLFKGIDIKTAVISVGKNDWVEPQFLYQCL